MCIHLYMLLSHFLPINLTLYIFREKSKMVINYIHVLHHLFYKIKNILVINELYVTPVNFLLGILFLLHLENMLAKGTIKGFSIYINISQL